MLAFSNEAHVFHLAPSLVVAVRGAVVLDVVGAFHGELGVIGVMRVELELPLEGSHVLSMDLEGKSPEDALPDETSLGIFQTKVVLVVHSLG